MEERRGMTFFLLIGAILSAIGMCVAIIYQQGYFAGYDAAEKTALEIKCYKENIDKPIYKIPIDCIEVLARKELKK